MIYIRRIVGSSMSLTFNEGDIVIFFRFKKYYPGNVIIADVDGREVIKRISYIEGDNVFIVGDNLAASTDSRNYGPIDKTAIKGRLSLCLPLSKLTAKQR